YKSADAGETWGVVSVGYFESPLFIDPTRSTVYAVRSPTGLSRSTDGGVTWSPLGLTQNQAPISVVLDPTNSNTMYAAVSGPALSGQAILKSVDGGRTWKAINTSISVRGASLVVSPVNPANIYIGTYSVFSKSGDGGTTFAASNSGLQVLNVGVLVPDPIDANILYAGGDGGLFRSVDSGGSWTQFAVFGVTAGVLPPGFPPPATPIPPAASTAVGSLLIDYTNPNTLYTSTFRTDGCFFSDILLFKSTDHGASWSDRVSPS